MSKVLRTLMLYACGIALLLGLALVAVPGRAANETAGSHHARGVAHHLRRSLDEASREYRRALELDPPRDLSAEEWQIVRRFAPRLYTTPTEFFPLKDFAAVLHPETRQIAYHLFWEDDIDFPEDNDPCDHEVVWVEYDADKKTLAKFWTYFHGRILEGGAAAIEDARRHSGRPRVNVQWGKHGSLPIGWDRLPIVANQGDAEKQYYPVEQQITIERYQEGTFRKLSTEGRRLRDHPLALRLGWPQKFTGTWKDFNDFSRSVEPLDLLEKRRMAAISRWNSAVINQHFLAYNFRPKTEWPREAQALAAASASGSAFPSAPSIADFQLPPKTVFDKSMPRYPNAWFYVDARLAGSYDEAVKLVTENLRVAMRLREDYGPFGNPEGCDFEVRLEHLQPWQVRAHRALQHSHAFHMRYYYSALKAQGLERARVAGRDYYRFGASAHYEVEHTNPNHADVEICPICGRTGEYGNLVGNLVELVHDPLGLELVLTGKIRGETVKFDDWEQREVGSIEGLKERFAIEHFTYPAQKDDKNTLRIGVVVIGPR